MKYRYGILLAVEVLFVLAGCQAKINVSETATSQTSAAAETASVNSNSAAEVFDPVTLETFTAAVTSETEEPATGETETTEEMLDLSVLPAGTILPEDAVARYGEDRCFFVAPISDAVFARMEGLTFKDYSPVNREELRYIRCLHKDLSGTILIGELVMHESVAEEICEIFHELYRAGYPIEKMRLADDYDAEDLVSAADNNTSGYNTRYVEFTDVLCRHAYGLAIDINPLYNVYYLPDQDLALPEEGYAYIDREADFPYKIIEGDLCYNLFTERGYTWGGIWGSPDYMHFEK